MKIVILMGTYKFFSSQRASTMVWHDAKIKFGRKLIFQEENFNPKFRISFERKLAVFSKLTFLNQKFGLFSNFVFITHDAEVISRVQTPTKTIFLHFIREKPKFSSFFYVKFLIGNNSSSVNSIVLIYDDI